MSVPVPSNGPGFLTSYVVVCLCSDKMIVRFVDIGEVDDHQCLSFPVMRSRTWRWTLSHNELICR